MAEQSTSQQKDQQMVSIILANVGTVICFRTGNPQDEKVLLPLFKPFIDEGEISNLPTFNFYAKLSATQAQEPLSGTTILLAKAGSDEVEYQVRKSSREQYALKQNTIVVEEKRTTVINSAQNQKHSVNNPQRKNIVKMLDVS